MFMIPTLKEANLESQEDYNPQVRRKRRARDDPM